MLALEEPEPTDAVLVEDAELPLGDVPALLDDAGPEAWLRDAELRDDEKLPPDPDVPDDGTLLLPDSAPLEPDEVGVLVVGSLVDLSDESSDEERPIDT